MDLAVEIPRDELGPVASNEMWGEIYDRVAELIREHRTTLVFVNTRRLSERVAHNLAERLGENAVLPHHGSLSRKLRLDAERRLKDGELRAVVATASLELGIDIGTVDLVCQIGSPRSIAVALQRVGRAGHWVGALPKGRLFATTRDELIECAALVRAIHRGELDRLEIPRNALDILAQQMVAACACEDFGEDELYELVTSAWSYRTLPRARFRFACSRCSPRASPPARGRSGAYLHRDGVNRRVRGRRGARLTAITSGGAIPDTAQYLVVAGARRHDRRHARRGFRRREHGRRRLPAGHHVLAHPPRRSRPRPRGGRPRRGSHHPLLARRSPRPHLRAVGGGLRAARGLLAASRPRRPTISPPNAASIQAALRAGARVRPRRPAPRSAPCRPPRRVVAERFFDEAGGMQLVIHAPFGARINRAWGLALRKRFCRSFNFELQAAATDNGIVISLGEQHSFPLEIVFEFLRVATVEEVLTQALLPAPMFTARWRWNASRALAIPRYSGGRKVPPPIQRMRADDLMAAVFPDQAACPENLTGEVRIPDHPLVKETIDNCLYEAMDLDGLKRLLGDIADGAIETVAIDTPEPSPFSHEILNANPYAYLDDAPLEERRARAVQMRRTLARRLCRRRRRARSRRHRASGGRGLAAHARRRRAARGAALVHRDARRRRRSFFRSWSTANRATTLTTAGRHFWVAAERLELVRRVYPDATHRSRDRGRPDARDSRLARALRRRDPARLVRVLRPQDGRRFRARPRPPARPRRPGAGATRSRRPDSARHVHGRRGRASNGATAACSRASTASPSAACAARSSRSRPPSSTRS